MDYRGRCIHVGSGSGLADPCNGNDKASCSCAEPAMEEIVAKFFDAVGELRLMMENQAVWLADRMDAQGVVKPEHTSENRHGEAAGPIAHPVFGCGICLEEGAEEDFPRIDGCEHPFCRACLRSYITSQLKERRYPMLCPTCMANMDTDDVPQSM